MKPHPALRDLLWLSACRRELAKYLELAQYHHYSPWRQGVKMCLQTAISYARRMQHARQNWAAATWGKGVEA